MRKRMIIFSIMLILTIVSCNMNISGKQTTEITNKNDVGASIMIEGEVTGIFFNIHAYYIIEGIDVDFHQESWECTINCESGIHCIVPVPTDGIDHYTLTGQLEGYRTNTVDIFVFPDEDWVWAQVELTPILSFNMASPTNN